MQLFNKPKSKDLLAVSTGECKPLSAIPDEAFASGMLGVGYAIEPSEGRFYAPVDGKIVSIAATRHAYTIEDRDGFDILVHIGVDTVQMDGEGFHPAVREGQSVKAGELLAEVELERILARGLPTISAVLITEPAVTGALSFRYGSCVGGRDAVMQCTGARKGRA